jgi:cation diffusion facilitator CzcD-associated flavoprotein CzcO
MDVIESLIIGAGPAGLAIAGRLRHAGKDFAMIEKGQHVAERWHHHYDRVHLHTIKKWSHLPHLPFPEEYPMYVPRQKLIGYLENYATHFNIKPQFGVEVRRIRKVQDELWEITTNTGNIHARNVILATGLNRIPNMPTWENMSDFNGTIVHSFGYKNPDAYHGSRVLVIGMGNTGAEIALDLAEASVPTWISVRGTINIVPRDLNGRPVQETSKLLARLPFGMGDWIGAKVQRLYFGDLSKYGLRKSDRYPAVELRETGKTPMIDVGTIKAIKEGRIHVVGGLHHFTRDGVVLENEKELKCEHIIVATGYRPQLQELIENIDTFLDKYGNPKGPIGVGERRGLFFVGFDNYKLGGVLGTINTDSETIARQMMKQ